MLYMVILGESSYYALLPPKEMGTPRGFGVEYRIIKYQLSIIEYGRSLNPIQNHILNTLGRPL